jgi:hypothetical protein
MAKKPQPEAGLKKQIAGTLCLMLFLLFFGARPEAGAGPYAPAPGNEGSTAIPLDHPGIRYWADGYTAYQPGGALEATWQTPEEALGRANGTSYDIVALGRGGRITLTFDSPIRNGEGWDFAVFENGFSDDYLELAWVEVSSNGTDFVRFDNVSLTPMPVEGFGTVDPTLVTGFAGKYRQGFGTPFDLSDLEEKSAVTGGSVDLSSITHVRLIDVIGDGQSLDSRGNPIYDPFPTTGSAGFDLDGIAVSNGAPYPSKDGENGALDPAEPPSEEGEAGFGGGGCFIRCVSP